MQKNIASLTVAGLLLLSAPAWSAEGASSAEGWIEDFDQAVKIAKEQKKDLFVDFTGSDWCGWCIKLHDQVFKFEEFSSVITKDYVLVSLDYPHSEAAKMKVPNPERNDELKDKYSIRGFPTVLLMSSDGIVYGQTGYQEGGAEAYVKHIQELRASGRVELAKYEKVRDDFNAVPADGKLAAIELVLTALDELPAGSGYAELLVKPAMEALNLDPKNEKGLKQRALSSLFKAGRTDAPLLAAARELDVKNTLGLLEQAVQAQFRSVTGEETAKAAIVELNKLNAMTFKDTEIGFELNFTAASWSAGPLQNVAQAKTYANLAKNIGSDNERMMGVLDELLALPDEVVDEDGEVEEEGDGI